MSDEKQKQKRLNITLTGDDVDLMRKVQAKLQVKHEPINVSFADAVIVALTKLDAVLDT